METRDLDGIDVEETTTVDEERQKNKKWEKTAKVAAGVGVGTAAGAGFMAMVDGDEATTPDNDMAGAADATETMEAETEHIAENNATDAWPQEHDTEAWPQKHDTEAWPQKHDTDAWPQEHDSEAWPQEHDAEAWPDDAVHLVTLNAEDVDVTPAVRFNGLFADMSTPDGHSLLLDINGDGLADIAMGYDEETLAVTSVSVVDESSTVRLSADDDYDQIDIPDDAVDDLSSDGYLFEM